jgi:hypothetical protein
VDLGDSQELLVHVLECIDACFELLVFGGKSVCDFGESKMNKRGRGGEARSARHPLLRCGGVYPLCNTIRSDVTEPLSVDDAWSMSGR